MPQLSASISTLLARLRQSRSLAGLASAFALKVLGTILSFALITLAARLLSPEDFGHYSVLFSAAGLLCISACCGQHVLLMRSWNEYLADGDAASLQGALRFAAATLVVACLVTGLAFYFWMILHHPFWLALAVVTYTLTTAVMTTSNLLVRTAIGVGIGDGLPGILAVLPSIVYLLACLVTGVEANIDLVFFFLTIGSVSVVLIHLVFMRRRLKTLFPDFGTVRPRFHLRAWTGRSFKLWLSSSLEAANQYVDVLALAYLMNPTVAGAYFVITRLANAFAMATTAVNMFASRHIPDLYYRGDRLALDRMLHSMALASLAIIAGGMLSMLLAGQKLLSLFNPDYVTHLPALLLLCVGTASMAAVGPASFVLMFTGQEGIFLGIIFASVALRALAFFVLVPSFGIMGAVIATTVALLAMAFLLRYSTRATSGIDSSIFNLLARGTTAPAR